MEDSGPVGLNTVRATASAIAGALAAAGASEEAALVVDAIRVGGAPPEQLLDLRSALVTTRNRWERLDDREVVAMGRRALAASKGLAIDL